VVLWIVVVAETTHEQISKMPKWRRHLASQTIANRIVKCVKVSARKVYVLRNSQSLHYWKLHSKHPPVRQGASMTGIPFRDTAEGRAVGTNIGSRVE
jgi:DNA polymerase III psi subunit